MKHYLNIFFISLTLLTTCVSNEVQAASLYWVGGSADWDATPSLKWSATSGGVGGLSNPTASDDVFFDAASGGVSVRMLNYGAVCKSIDFTGFSGSFDQPNADNISVNGSVTLSATMTIPNFFAADCVGGTSSTFTSNGFSNIILYISKTAGATITLQDDFIGGDGTGFIFLVTGNFNSNGQTVTLYGFPQFNSGTRTLTMGSSTWNVYANNDSWDLSNATNLTIVPNTSILKILPYASSDAKFVGGGYTYGNVHFDWGSNSNRIDIRGSNTFTDLKDNGTTAHTLSFEAGTTTTVSTFTVSGTAGNLISINSNNGAGSLSTSTHTLSDASGTTNCDYLNIQHSIATGGAVWNPGSHSTNNQGVATAGSGWVFPVTTTNPMLMGVGK